MKMSDIVVGETYAMSQTNDVYADPDVKRCRVLEKNQLIEVRDAGVLVQFEDGSAQVVHSRRIKVLWDDFTSWKTAQESNKARMISVVKRLQSDAYDVTLDDTQKKLRISVDADDFVLLLGDI